MDELEKLKEENELLKTQVGLAEGKEPAGLWPSNLPKYRVIRKGPDRGEIVTDAFVLLPRKHERDRLTLLDYATRCRADGDNALADDIERWCQSPTDTPAEPA